MKLIDYVCALLLRLFYSKLQTIKYPKELYKQAISEGWEKEFSFLFDLKTAYSCSFIKNYKDFDSIIQLLSNKICRETYFKYIHFLNRKKLIKINYNTVILPSYKKFDGGFRYAGKKDHLIRMEAQVIRRNCDKQTSKIKTDSNLKEIKQLKFSGGAITFDVVNMAATVTLSCATIGKMFNKSKTWGFNLKKRLCAKGLLSVENIKELYGADRPANYAANKGFRLYRGVWIRQWADRIRCFIDIDERPNFVKVDYDTKLRYMYCNDI